MWSVKLSDSQRDALRALIKAQNDRGGSLRGALEALDFARWDDLPEAELPWDHVAELARMQGIGEADVVWDLTARPRPPARPKTASRRRTQRKPARR